MTSPYFPSVDPTTLTVRDKHLPARLSDAALGETIDDTAASLFTSGTHTNISFAYDDANRKVNASVPGVGVDNTARALAKAGIVAAATFSQDGALGTADTGQVWELQDGAPVVSNGKLSASAAYVAALPVGRSDYDLEVLVVPQTGTAASLLFRVGPTVADRLALAVDMTNGLRLNKVDTNVTTALKTTAKTFVAGTTYRIRVLVVADSIVVHVDGVETLTYTLSAAEQTKYSAYSRVGLRQNNATTGVTFDDFLVRMPPVVGPVTNSPDIPLALIDAKGDLVVGSAPDTAARLPAGADGLALVAGSTSAAGLRYLGYSVALATGDDSDLTTALSSAPAEATLVAVKVAGT